MSRSRLFSATGHLLLMLAASSCGKGSSPTGPQPAGARTAAAAPKAQPAPQAAIPRGEALYARMCAVCHGQNGEGYKADRAPALGHPDFLDAVSDDFLRTAILEGRRATTMSAWGRERGGPLTQKDADDLIAFMRTWAKGRPRTTLDERPLTGDAARGRAIFERECVRCHGAGGLGGPHTQLANAYLQRTASNGFLRYAIERGRPGTPMEGFAGKLSAQDIDDVITFVREAGEVVAAELTAATETKQPPLPLGPVPLNPRGRDAVGFTPHPGTTSADVVRFQLSKGARMAFLDARAPSDYTQEHIAGAVSVPFYDPDPYYAKLPKNAWLVCYCACPHAESQMLAQKLVDHGFTKVTVLDEGLGFWKMKGYPVRTGPKP